jgi:pimeloyl-ACP methyl ester carboxylesterase
MTRTRFLVGSGAATIDVIAEGDGPPLVLVPSVGRGSEDLGLVAEGLSVQGFRVLRPQPRGVGRSVGPMTDLTYVDWAADLAAVVAANGSGPAVLLGHAAGSRYARTCAVAYPHLVRGLVVAAGAADPPPGHLVDVLARSADPTLAAGVRLSALRDAFFAPGHDPSGWLDGWSSATLRAQWATASAPGWRLAGDVPILDLIGEHDVWRPPDSRLELRELLGPRVTVAVVPDAGHALLPENPDHVVSMVAAWVRERFPDTGAR